MCVFFSICDCVLSDADYKKYTAQALLELVIEELETRRPTGDANYDYLVLQATNNSIPFYESMGFVRVGAITEVDESKENKLILEKGISGDGIPPAPISDNKKQLRLPDYLVTSDVFTHTVKKGGTTLGDVAKYREVDVWDLVFLNKGFYPGISPGSRLMAGTLIHVPKKSNHRNRLNTGEQKPEFFVAKENDTARKIAAKFDIDCAKVVEANSWQLPGLTPSSRLRNGTRVQISRLDLPVGQFHPYAHWSFPDDNFEEGEPSYMMARKLNRRRTKKKSVGSSLAVTVSEEHPITLLAPASPPAMIARTSPRRMKTKAKRPPGPFFLFAAEYRESLKDMSLTESSKILSDLWRELPQQEKAKYKQLSAQAKASFKSSESHNTMSRLPFTRKTGGSNKLDLFNRVVKLKDNTITEGSEYKYW